MTFETSACEVVGLLYKRFFHDVLEVEEAKVGNDIKEQITIPE